MTMTHNDDAGANGERTKLGIETHGKGCYHVDATNPDFRK